MRGGEETRIIEKSIMSVEDRRSTGKRIENGAGSGDGRTLEGHLERS